MLTVVVIIPLVWNLYLTFTEWRGIKPPIWIGPDNWVALMQDQKFWTSFGNSIWMIVAMVIVPTAIGLVLALTGVTLPRAIHQPLELLADLAIPTVLLAFGIALVTQTGRDDRESRVDLWLAIVFKVLVMPALAYVLARWAFGLSPEQTAVATNLEAAREIARQLRLRNLGRCQQASASYDPATGAGSLQSCARPICDQITLKLCDHRKDMEHHSALRRGRVDLLIQGPQANLPFGKLVGDCDQLLDAPRQPVQPPNNKGVVAG